MCDRLSLDLYAGEVITTWYSNGRREMGDSCEIALRVVSDVLATQAEECTVEHRLASIMIIRAIENIDMMARLEESNRQYADTCLGIVRKPTIEPGLFHSKRCVWVS